MAATAQQQPLTPDQIIALNDEFLLNALRRNYGMPAESFSRAGQTIDIELESVPGWAHKLLVTVNVDLDITVGTGGTPPSWSEFFPYNIFSNVELSLGGGPFQRVSPFFYFLRKSVMHPGWVPGYAGPKSYAYASTAAWNVPSTPSATAGSSTDNQIKFTMEIPLQSQHGAIAGHLPLGDSKITGKLRLTVTPDLYGTDHWESPVVGGTNVTSVTIGSSGTNTVGVDIKYRTTPATKKNVPDPIVGQVLNVQQQVVPFTSAGQNTPIFFKDPFLYLRLWHIIIDGTGAPNTTGVTNFELDLTTGYEQFRYDSPDLLQGYFADVNALYKEDLPTGVLVHDLWSGTDPANPNGDQMIDGSLFQTLQTRVRVSSGTNVASPAKIITFAEALSKVDF